MTSSAPTLTDPKPSSGQRRTLLMLGAFVVGIIVLLLIARPYLPALEAFVIDNAVAWGQWVRANLLVYSLLFVAAYATISVLGLPVSIIFSLGGAAVSSLALGSWGGALLSTLLVWIAVVGGSWGLFEFVKRYGAASFDAVIGPYIGRFRAGFERDQFFYMLASRFTPVPPAVMTVAPAVLGAKRHLFVLAACIGFLPGVFVYASLGARLGQLLAKRSEGQELGFATVVTLENTWPLLALLALSIVPIIIRQVNKGETPS